MATKTTPPGEVIPMNASTASQGAKSATKSKSVTMQDGLIKMSLRCIFTQEELVERAKQLGEVNRKKVNLEDDKKRVTTEYASRIADAASEVGILSEKVTNGYEHRDVECTVKYDTPKPGMKTIYRNDTGVQVDVRQMNDEERQLKLALLSEAQGDGASAPTIKG